MSLVEHATVGPNGGVRGCEMRGSDALAPTWAPSKPQALSVQTKSTATPLTQVADEPTMTLKTAARSLMESALVYAVGPLLDWN